MIENLVIRFKTSINNQSREGGKNSATLIRRLEQHKIKQAPPSLLVQYAQMSTIPPGSHDSHHFFFWGQH